MIDVAVGQPDFVDRDASQIDGTLDVRQIAAGINDYGTLRGLAPQQGTVLLEGRNRNDNGLGFGHGPCAPEGKGLVGRIVARACLISRIWLLRLASPLCHAWIDVARNP